VHHQVADEIAGAVELVAARLAGLPARQQAVWRH
jgi:hypothetical protein